MPCHAVPHRLAGGRGGACFLSWGAAAVAAWGAYDTLAVGSPWHGIQVRAGCSVRRIVLKESCMSQLHIGCTCQNERASGHGRGWVVTAKGGWPAMYGVQLAPTASLLLLVVVG